MAKKAAAATKPTSKAPPARAQSAEMVSSAQPGAGTALEPSHAQIAQRAFELYVQRGGGDGGEMSDWLRAERELFSRS
jgi:hypothetical protein